MKTVLKTSLLAILSFFVLSGFSLRENPEDPPRGEKKKKLKMVKVEDGKKTVIDTVLAGDEDAFEWFSHYDLGSDIDSVVKEKLKKIEVIIDEVNGNEKVKVFAFGDEDFDMDFDFDIDTETIVDGDSIVKVIMMKHGDGTCKEKIIRMKRPHVMVKFPDVPHPPMPCKIIKKHLDDKMVIFLEDPDIISFKKKDLSGGREKIEIIRKKSEAEEIDVEVEVIEED